MLAATSTKTNNNSAGSGSAKPRSGSLWPGSIIPASDRLVKTVLYMKIYLFINMLRYLWPVQRTALKMCSDGSLFATVLLQHLYHLQL